MFNLLGEYTYIPSWFVNENGHPVDFMYGGYGYSNYEIWDKDKGFRFIFDSDDLIRAMQCDEEYYDENNIPTHKQLAQWLYQNLTIEELYLKAFEVYEIRKDGKWYSVREIIMQNLSY